MFNVLTGNKATVQLHKGQMVGFTYNDPHKSELQTRTGTVDNVKGNAIVIRDNARGDAFRSFSGAFVTNLAVVA